MLRYAWSVQAVLRAEARLFQTPEHGVETARINSPLYKITIQRSGSYYNALLKDIRSMRCCVTFRSYLAGKPWPTRPTWGNNTGAALQYLALRARLGRLGNGSYRLVVWFGLAVECDEKRSSHRGRRSSRMPFGESCLLLYNVANG